MSCLLRAVPTRVRVGSGCAAPAHLAMYRGRRGVEPDSTSHGVSKLGEAFIIFTRNNKAGRGRNKYLLSNITVWMWIRAFNLRQGGSSGGSGAAPDPPTVVRFMEPF